MELGGGIPVSRSNKVGAAIVLSFPQKTIHPMFVEDIKMLQANNPVVLSATAGFKPFPDAVRKVRGKRVDSGEGCPFSAEISLHCEYYPVPWLRNNPYCQAIFRAEIKWQIRRFLLLLLVVVQQPPDSRKYT